MIRPHYVPLYQSICHSGRLADLRVKDARFFYCCLLTHCDSYGRMQASPHVVYAKIWALFGTKEHAAQCLDDLERVGLIVRYEGNGETLLAIPDWEEKAGKVGRPERRGDPTYPKPPSRGTGPANAGALPTSPASRARANPSQEEPIQEDPSRDARAGKPRRGRGRPRVESVSIDDLPEKLRSAEMVTALTEFLAYRVEKGDPMTPIGLRNLLLLLEPHGTALGASALRSSMANGWKGVFPEKCASGAPSALQPKPGGMREWFAQQDALAATRTVDVEGGTL